MSILVLEKILRELEIVLEELDKKILYEELLRCFGIIGGYGECERLEKLWNDPIYNKEIRRYIEAWVEYHKKRRTVEVYA